jgi:hypothetical protein
MPSLEELAAGVYIDESKHGDSVYLTITGDESNVKAYWKAWRIYWGKRGCQPLASEPTTIGEKMTMHISRYSENI